MADVVKDAWLIDDTFLEMVRRHEARYLASDCEKVDLETPGDLLAGIAAHLETLMTMTEREGPGFLRNRAKAVVFLAVIGSLCGTCKTAAENLGLCKPE